MNKIINTLISIAAVLIIMSFPIYETFRKEKMRWWIIVLSLAAFLGVYTAEIIVFTPDWWEDMTTFYERILHG
jgi:putative effector of murein hydrolase